MASSSRSSASASTRTLFEVQIRVILLGESGTGKTSISNRVTGGEYKEVVQSTIGVAYRRIKFTTSVGTTADLAIWDTAGQEKFRSLVPIYYRDADAALFVFDITNLKSFQQMDFWLDTIPRMHPTAKSCSILIGNKSDLAAERVVSRAEAEALAASKGIVYFETSAKYGDGLSDALDILVTTFIELWMQSRPKKAVPSTPPAVPVATRTEPEEDSGCC